VLHYLLILCLQRPLRSLNKHHAAQKVQGHVKEYWDGMCKK